MTEVLLSDIDGTLVDSNALHAEAWRRAFEHFGIEVGLDETWSQIGKGGDQGLCVRRDCHVARRKYSIDRRCAPRPAKFQSRLTTNLDDKSWNPTVSIARYCAVGDLIRFLCRP